MLCGVMRFVLLGTRDFWVGGWLCLCLSMRSWGFGLWNCVDWAA